MFECLGNVQLNLLMFLLCYVHIIIGFIGHSSALHIVSKPLGAWSFRSLGLCGSLALWGAAWLSFLALESPCVDFTLASLLYLCGKFLF